MHDRSRPHRAIGQSVTVCVIVANVTKAVAVYVSLVRVGYHWAVVPTTLRIDARQVHVGEAVQVAVRAAGHTITCKSCWTLPQKEITA